MLACQQYSASTSDEIEVDSHLQHHSAMTSSAMLVKQLLENGFDLEEPFIMVNIDAWIK